jgi:hypothetical protein
MRRTTLLFILALMPSFVFSSVNATKTVPENGEPIVVVGAGHIRPRSIEPECYYLDGYVYIIGDSSVTSISGTVTRLSDNMQWSNSCTGNALQIAVPTDAGSYHLTLSLSDGSSYYGDYTL